jgi:hypothetical membrane protein
MQRARKLIHSAPAVIAYITLHTTLPFPLVTAPTIAKLELLEIVPLQAWTISINRFSTHQ